MLYGASNKEYPKKILENWYPYGYGIGSRV
jgi:hypothetical protein